MHRIFHQDDPGAQGWPRGFVVAQRPNTPLAVALVAQVAAWPLSGGAEDVARAVLYVGLAAWAYEEVAHGVNWFRRLLGGAALVFVVIRVAEGFAG